uniref:Uncharacterized protein n=1 Tax=Arundo donax TaxID=35708 RepID=A0A0A9DHT1_ARUDO
MTVGNAPDHRPRRPSSRTIVLAQCIGPLYLSRSGLSPFCCCNLIFTTSKGVTMRSASMTPAPNPDASRPCAETMPVVGSLNADCSTALEPSRSAYLSVRWVAKGVSPFQSARTPSARATVAPQCATLR